MQPDIQMKSQSTTMHRPSTAIAENFFLRLASHVWEGWRKYNEMYSLSPYVVCLYNIYIILYMVVVKVLLALNEFCDLSYRHTRATLRFDFSHCTLVSSFARRYSINQYIHIYNNISSSSSPHTLSMHIVCPHCVRRSCCCCGDNNTPDSGVEQSHRCRSAHNIIVCKPLYAYNIYLCIRYV